MAKFKVLVGGHLEGGKYYKAGEIVDSKSDLTKHNVHGGKRYERVGSSAVSLEDKKDYLDAMTLDELKSMAAEEEIDLGSAKTQEEVVKVIRKNL